ncbi:MAG: GtrA family protein, partial [Gammaproteobacteria bacterium]|nr:GtrA family protein [Gammaproteobacteria bacterium]
MKTAIWYVLFALIATGVNLLVQYPFFELFSAWWVIYVALFFGTLAGLVTKYWLDKRWIFVYTSKSKQDDLSRFGWYSLMGVFTTIIFWGTEMAFYHLASFEGAQYV